MFIEKMDNSCLQFNYVAKMTARQVPEVSGKRQCARPETQLKLVQFNPTKCFEYSR